MQGRRQLSYRVKVAVSHRASEGRQQRSRAVGGETIHRASPHARKTHCGAEFPHGDTGLQHARERCFLGQRLGEKSGWLAGRVGWGPGSVAEGGERGQMNSQDPAELG